MAKKMSRWRISRIRGSKAEQLGVVTAADAEAAIKVAIKEFEVADKHRQSQLAARPNA
jgi:hypothetical protein